MVLSHKFISFLTLLFYYEVIKRRREKLTKLYILLLAAFHVYLHTNQTAETFYPTKLLFRKIYGSLQQMDVEHETYILKEWPFCVILFFKQINPIFPVDKNQPIQIKEAKMDTTNDYSYVCVCCFSRPMQLCLYDTLYVRGCAYCTK